MQVYSPMSNEIISYYHQHIKLISNSSAVSISPMQFEFLELILNMKMCLSLSFLSQFDVRTSSQLHIGGKSRCYYLRFHLFEAKL